MSFSPAERLVVLGGAAYLAALAIAMSALSYDIWGAMVTVPVLLLVGLVGVRALFDGELRNLRNIMLLGLVLRFVGAAARYWVGFTAYGGSIDAASYHTYATDAARAVWSGEGTWTSIIPSGTGTPFIQRSTALIYTLTGTSRLAGFMFFTWMTFWGVAWFVKAACLAVPGLEKRWYAVVCVAAPSLIYWPSSIGKEALMVFSLGLASLGFAGVITGNRRVTSILACAVGLGLAVSVRPHMAGIWIAASVPALLVAVFGRRHSSESHRSRAAERLGLVLVLGVATVALLAVGTATQRYLNPGTDSPTVGTDITSILEETTKRTSDAGSAYIPPTISGPASWPKAVVRTLTRPLLFEARDMNQLVAALETTALIVACLWMFRRLLQLPRLVLRVPYLTFAVTALFVGGLAYSSFANLGVLTRQKSLLFPFLLLLVCLPPAPAVGARRRRQSMVDADELPELTEVSPARITTDEAFAAARQRGPR